MKATTLLNILLGILPALGNTPPASDRNAILSMAGVFEVSFAFTEDASLIMEPEATSKPYTEKALEVVVVVENTEERISLQHLLIVADEKTQKDTVVKHWSQIWTWQDSHIIDYSGSEGMDQWSVSTLETDAVLGAWTQLVTNVDDTPRYEGIGQWQHKHGISKWTSQDTRRPLPRREYTKRDDYDYLYGTNSHTVTAHGWYHFQDNFKVVDRSDVSQAIAHEDGVNSYKRTSSPRAETAINWWKENSEAWNGIRNFWIERSTYAQEYFIFTSNANGKGLSAVLADLVQEKASPSQIEISLLPYIVKK